MTYRCRLRVILVMTTVTSLIDIDQLTSCDLLMTVSDDDKVEPNIVEPIKVENRYTISTRLGVNVPTVVLWLHFISGVNWLI